MLSDLSKQILQELIKRETTDLAQWLKSTNYDIEEWLYKFCEILHNVYINHGHIVIGFVILPDFHSSLKLSEELLNEIIVSNRETCNVGLDFSVNLYSDLQSADGLAISTFSLDNECVVFRLDGEMLQIYVNGVYRKIINVMHPTSTSEIRVAKGMRSHRDYKILIDDHSKRRLLNLMNEYWEDRERRILRPGKTEQYFQMSLYDWFQQYLSDARPKLEQRTDAGDRTDIDIYAWNEGTHYIIEIKWLGKNASGTTYDFDQFIVGMGQIATYLNRDEYVNEAYLVCYDGRPEEEHLTKSFIDKSLLPPKSDCTLIFLESETANKKGNKYENRSKLAAQLY